MPEDLAASLEDTQTPPDTGDASQPPAETPATIDWESADNPYKGRYEDLRPQYDRIHPRYNQYEQVVQGLSNPETAPEILKAFGYDIEDEGTPDPDDLDPEERFEQRFGKIENYLQEQSERAEEAELAQLEKEFFSQEFQRLEVPDDDRKLIERLARETPDDEGIPDVEAAVKELEALVDARFKKYKKSKKAPRVENGSAGTEVIDMNDEEAVTRALANEIEAARDD